jgi:hypothetical protein
MKVSGSVNSITTKPITARSGKTYTIWYIDIDGTSVNMGFNKPGFTVGDNISLDCQANKYGELEVIKAGSPSGGRSAPSTPVGAPASPKSGYTPKPFPVPRNSSDMSIIRQNSLTNANATVASLVQSGAIQDGLEWKDMAELVIEIAYMYADFSSGQREVKAIANLENNE